MGDSKSDSSGPSDALIQLISPDGYYTYLGIQKVEGVDVGLSGSGSASTIDEDLIKKNYRKLSLKHHPDKRGGDADTFRVLNRAQKVLKNPKLRAQYDILGLDLDDDDMDDAVQGDDKQNEEGDSSTAQGIVHEIASMCLAAVMHLGVRTVLMGLTSVVLARYRLTLIPALLFLSFIAYRIYSMTQLPPNHPSRVPTSDLWSPVLLAVGLLCMFRGGSGENASWLLFWFGESLVLGVFTLNSLGETIPKTWPVIGGISVFAILSALWFRGKVWNYVIVVGIEGLLVLFIVMAFPVMEMLLEAILNEKLRKVGDKVRAHQKLLESYYTNKQH